MKRSLPFVLAAFIALVGAEAAQAADVCLATAGPDKFVIKKAKKLKANAAVPLTGIWFAGAFTAPFDGSASMQANGTTAHAGIFVHSGSTSPVNFTVEWTADSTYAGTGGYDANGDYASEGPITLTVVDCSTFTLP